MTDQTTATPVEDAADGARIDTTRAKGYRKRRVRIEFAAPHEGQWVDVWVNCKNKILEGFSDEDGIKPTLCKVILDHGLVDAETGDPLPKPLTPEAFGELDQPFYLELVYHVTNSYAEAAKIPKSSKRG